MRLKTKTGWRAIAFLFPRWSRCVRSQCYHDARESQLERLGWRSAKFVICYLSYVICQRKCIGRRSFEVGALPFELQDVDRSIDHADGDVDSGWGDGQRFRYIAERHLTLPLTGGRPDDDSVVAQR